MALCSSIEVAVHIGGLNSNDLWTAGLCHLRVALFQGKPSLADSLTQEDRTSTTSGQLDPVQGLTPALPLLSRDPEFALANSSSQGWAASRSSDGKAFRTKTMVLSGRGAHVQFNDVALFRMEEALGKVVNATLELRLMWADAPHGLDEAAGERPAIKAQMFREVTRQHVQLTCLPMECIHSTTSLCFDDYNFCEARIMVHMGAVGVRCRMLPPPPGGASYLGDELAAAAWRLGDAEFDDEVQGVAALCGRLRVLCKRRLDVCCQELRGFLDQVATRQGWKELLKRSESQELEASPSAVENQVDDVTLLRDLVQDLSIASTPVLELWQRMVRMLPYAVSGLLEVLCEEEERQHIRFWEDHIFAEFCPTGNLKVSSDHGVQNRNVKRASGLRKADSQQSLGSPMMRSPSLRCVQQPQCPIIFEQRYGQSPRRHPGDDVLTTPREQAVLMDGLHCVVLVHGFMGNSWDMRLFKNQLVARFGRARYLCARANENDTNGDIGAMGKALAEEVKNFVQAMKEPVGRVSFVCHSIGGLVVRSCLPLLGDLVDRLFTYVSLSTPHLGFMHADRSLVKTGLWVASKVQKSLCLEQLQMSDADDPKESFLFRLSGTPGLAKFKHVVFMSSCQDQYAPFHSARVEVASHNSELGSGAGSMVERLLKPMRPERILRLDVNFDISGNDFDTFIGRAAHIQFIENHEFMRMFTCQYAYLFQ
mmetsp:Transcript_54623/g.130346  ORF Transcript_54623/g.130346 Transcript_54623/m.130346 type:complete len:708 (-) Transcript_54623:52-2175(-)